jgi:hypothetical protein
VTKDAATIDMHLKAMEKDRVLSCTWSGQRKLSCFPVRVIHSRYQARCAIESEKVYLLDVIT